MERKQDGIMSGKSGPMATVSSMYISTLPWSSGGNAKMRLLARAKGMCVGRGLGLDIFCWGEELILEVSHSLQCRVSVTRLVTVSEMQPHSRMRHPTIY